MTKKQKHITIPLIPFGETLEVYFFPTLQAIRKVFPYVNTRIDANAFHAYYTATDTPLYLIIIIKDKEFIEHDWQAKVGLITHEVVHCVDKLFSNRGHITDTEVRAYYTQYILTKILCGYNFYKDRLK